MAALAAVAVLSGCDRTVDGVAAWTGGSPQTATGPHRPTKSGRPPLPGIETTVPERIPPNAFVCFPPLVVSKNEATKSTVQAR